MRRFLALIFSLLASCFAASFSYAQETEQQDSLVRLINADVLRQYVVGDNTFRKVMGKARFLHHDTYLLCDTALWNVDSSYIDAWGNVKILQDETVLESEKMIYLIDENLAQFRGNLVQLQDKDANTLRTRHLDYNTKDSVAVFQNGASMRDKDGQIIESSNGIYDSKANTFTFTENVNMFTDSIFVKTSELVYNTENSVATFSYDTNAWKEENMLASDDGWYDRNRDLFFFRGNVHLLTEDQECWSDSLYFNRTTMNVSLFGNAQVSDTTRNVHGVAGHVDYVDSLSQITLMRKPAVISMVEEENGVRDTVYFGADTLVYYTRRKCDIDSSIVALAASRLESVNIDPVGNFRRQAAEAAAKAAAEAALNDPNMVAKQNAEKMKKQAETARKKEMAEAEHISSLAPADSTLMSADSTLISSDSTLTSIGSTFGRLDGRLAPTDSLPSLVDSMTVAADSTSAVSDSVAVIVQDTTDIGFLTALRNVRLFKKNMQVVCDSLHYTDLDSLAYLYNSPIVWNEIKHQYMADSIAIVVRNNTMKQANLMSNAFIHIQEDTLHYDQIKGAEMTAYFDKDTQLERFDALGGASALFYLEENGSYATVNKKEAKMLSAEFKDGDINRIFYFDAPKSDGYPVVQLSDEDKTLKGFSWQPEKRPEDRFAITDIELRPGQRSRYENVPRAQYRNTDIYFPGYIEGIYTEIIERDSINRVNAAERRRLKQLNEERERFVKDSLDAAHIADSLAQIREKAVADSLHSIAVKDSLARVDSIRLAAADSVAFADSVKRAELESRKTLTPAEKKELRIAKKEERKEAKIAAKEARIKAREEKWKRLDERDAAKAEKKAARKAARLRKNKLKALRDAEKEARKEALLLEKYKKEFTKELLRQKQKDLEKQDK